MTTSESILKRLNEIDNIDKLFDIFLNNLTTFRTDNEVYICYVSRLKYLQECTCDGLVVGKINGYLTRAENEFNNANNIKESYQEASLLGEAVKKDKSVRTKNYGKKNEDGLISPTIHVTVDKTSTNVVCAIERGLIIALLREDYKKVSVARFLGITPRTLRDKCEYYGIYNFKQMNVVDSNITIRVETNEKDTASTRIVREASLPCEIIEGPWPLIFE